MKSVKVTKLERSQIKKEVKKDAKTTACCGGTPVTNGDACCKWDEEKNVEGESGCGCNTSPNSKTGSGCC